MMWRDNVANSLRELGIEPEDCQVLKLLPLVYTAWADGKLEPVERERILAYASLRLVLGPNGSKILCQWLSRRPSHDYALRGLRALRWLAYAADEPQVDIVELQSLLSHCEDLARATAESTGNAFNVGPEEEDALHEIATILQVDNGQTWSELVRELDQAPLVVPPPAPSQPQNEWRASLPRAPAFRLPRLA
jgi:hypothetical protein